MTIATFDVEKLRQEFKCNDLYRLVKIPAEDIASGRHSMAECCNYNPVCRNPVRYYQVVAGSPDGSLDTEFYCEECKPD